MVHVPSDPTHLPSEQASPVGPPRDERPLSRRILPFAIAAALIALLYWRLDLHAFVEHLRHVYFPGFFAFTGAFMVLLLSADAVATSYVYRRTICPIPTGEFFLVRGASYLPSLLNHHVGQAWLTWYLSRVHQAPLWRVAGATLLVYVTTFGSLFVFGAISLLFEHNEAHWLGPTIAAGFGAGIAYLVVIYLRPRVLATRQVLAPLFEVGVRGHLAALALRVPHMIVLFLGSWLPFYFFGVKIPPGAAFAYVPVLMVVVALPITPQGVGTRDWFSLHYFSGFASGTAAEREAAVAATTLTFVAALTIIQTVLSFVLMQRALAVLARKIESSKKTAPQETEPRAAHTP